MNNKLNDIQILNPFQKAKWIWYKDTYEPDEYAVFQSEFNFQRGKVMFRVCAETNYVAYLNGERIAYGQFAGYKNIKYYDEIDISVFVKKGRNVLQISVWYEGFDGSATHIEDGAGVIFEVQSETEVLSCSSARTFGAIDGAYISGRKKLLTIQLGYTSGMVNGENNVAQYAPCVEFVRDVYFEKRPVQKLVDGVPVVGKLIDEGKRLYDLGREEAGYLFLNVDCENTCAVTVSYGEHIYDGEVRRRIAGGYKNLGRDFSLDFICKKGNNRFENRFVRLAGRYLQVYCDKPVKINAIGIIPVYYPLTEKSSDFLKGIDKKIYDTCVRTLRLCMHEHYEDCPWREQALYSLDSRNQMLCGYYAFQEKEFQRANLVFMSHGTREDGLLELTYPAVNTPAIPFFSLIYIVAVNEYVVHTGDNMIIDEVWKTIKSIVDVFMSRLGENCLIENFPAPYWNFYEWSKGSHNDDELKVEIPRVQKTELLLNCAFLYAMTAYENLCKMKGRVFAIPLEKVRNAIQKTFYDQERNLYFLSNRDKTCSQLGNAFATIIGLGNKGIIEAIKNDDSLVPATLSMLGFVYDALLQEKGNEQFILNDIRSKYGYMLEKGATSFWETIGGAFNVGSAQSLCHGWSAIPVYYYNKILNLDSRD